MRRRINHGTKSLPFIDALANATVKTPSQPIQALPHTDYMDEYESDMRFVQDFLLPWSTNHYMDKVSMDNLFKIAEENQHLQTRAHLQNQPIVLLTAETVTEFHDLLQALVRRYRESVDYLSPLPCKESQANNEPRKQASTFRSLPRMMRRATLLRSPAQRQQIHRLHRPCRPARVVLRWKTFATCTSLDRRFEGIQRCGFSACT